MFYSTKYAESLSVEPKTAGVLKAKHFINPAMKGFYTTWWKLMLAEGQNMILHSG